MNWFFIILITFQLGCERDTDPPDNPVQARYYVAVEGNDNNPGTIDRPFATWQKAWDVVKPGELVYIRGGIYTTGKTSGVICNFNNKSGTTDKLIKIWAFPGELPVLSMEDVNITGESSMIYFVNSHYCHFKGLRITGLKQPAGGASVFGWNMESSSNNIIENCEFDHIGGPPFTLSGKSGNNLILNCDAHHAANPYSPTPYGGADGFQAINIPAGYDNNVFNGCRAWWNSDDGFDTWGSESSVIFKNCWSFWNGYIPETSAKGGDGNGFKLGETLASSKTNRYLFNCLAFENRVHGFDENNALCVISLFNCTSYQNKGIGIRLNLNNISHVIRNSVSWSNGSDYDVGSTVIRDHNSWEHNVSSNDFSCLNVSGIDRKRDTDGSLPYNCFLRLAGGSILIDAGVDVGLPYHGKAPDIGAFETN